MGANLKTTFTADTGPLKKGSQEAAQAIKSFEKTGNDAFSAIGSSLGINTDKLKQLTNAFKGAGMAMSKAFGDGNTAAKAMATSITKASATMAGLAVAGLAIAWKELNSQADYFMSTLDGTAIKAGMEAYRSVFKSVMMDMKNLSNSTENINNFKKNWFDAFRAIGAFFRNIQNEDTGGNSISKAIKITTDEINKAKESASRAEEIAKRIREIELEQADNLVTIAELDNKIADAKLTARDKTAELADREQALLQLKQNIAEKSAVQIDLAQELITLQEEYNGLSATTPEDQVKLNQYKIAALQITTNEKNQYREILEVTKEIASQYDAMNKLGETLLDNIINLPIELDFSKDDAALKAELQEEIDQIIENVGKPVIPLGVDIIELKKQIGDAQGLLTNLVAGISESIGELIGGSLVGDTESVQNSLNNLVKVIGNSLKTLGSMFIALGIGKRVMETSMNAVQLIAAGAAMIAAGAAINVAFGALSQSVSDTSGSLASSTSFSAGTSNTINSAYMSAQQNITVTGNVTVKGSDLQIALKNEETRKGIVG